jgi:hypothetical protein
MDDKIYYCYKATNDVNGKAYMPKQVVVMRFMLPFENTDGSIFILM